MKATISKVNGKKIGKAVFKRNAVDILTLDMPVDDADDLADEATIEQLKLFLARWDSEYMDYDSPAELLKEIMEV